MKLLNSIPALPVADVARSVEFYRDKLGLTLAHFDEGGFAILRRDAVELHLWSAGDHSWKTRTDDTRPVVSGAESFLAGTGSCRIGVEGVDELHGVIEPLGVLHPNAPLRETAFGTREFAVLDPDNNLVTFFERVPR